MITMTDELMRETLAKAKAYCVVILKATQKRHETGSNAIVHEHARRNFVHRAEGILSIVCPITDGSEVRGIGIYHASAEKVRELMEDDPGVKAGIFSYEVHPCKGFPGDALP